MHLCIFNPEHDLCIAKGRAHYVPPRSAIEFALREAGIMQVLYPEAECYSVYDEALRPLLPHAEHITAWGWDAVVKHELLKRGATEALLPTDEQIGTIRQLQHRSTVLPLQGDTRAVSNEGEINILLQENGGHWVLKAPWSGAGRGIRWVHHELTEIDRAWLAKTVRKQGMVIAEPRRDVVADMALEYRAHNGDLHFVGYSLFRTASGVYQANLALPDDEIEREIGHLTHPHTQRLQEQRLRVEQWLRTQVAPYYNGPIGMDLMVDRHKCIHVAEMNLRHTMGMVAHATNNPPMRQTEARTQKER